MKREKEKHSGGPEIWSSVLSENALEFMSRELELGQRAGDGWEGERDMTVSPS